VATVFTWIHGGKNVAVTGTWNNWNEIHPLNRSEHDFTSILELPPGVHQYKFIVDGKWKHAPEQPVATDSRGNINNCMEIKEFRLGQSRGIPFGKKSPPGSYTQEIPDIVKFSDIFEEHSLSVPAPGGPQKKKTDEPPTLPPHLFGTRAVLNTETDDPTVLPLPNHVMLNHLYFKEHEDDQKRNILILGTTQRYREKFVTMVFYRPAPSLEDTQSSTPTTATTTPTTKTTPNGGDTTGRATVSEISGSIARQLFSPQANGNVGLENSCPHQAPPGSPNTLKPGSSSLTTAALTMDRGNGKTTSSDGEHRESDGKVQGLTKHRMMTGGAIVHMSTVHADCDPLTTTATTMTTQADYTLRHNS